MRIWLDADNAPHVLVMKPLIDELRLAGHEVVVTARRRAGTVDLLRMKGIPCTVAGGAYPAGMAGKVIGTLARSLALARAGARFRADVSFGHGSRALPLASRLAGIPSVTMYDYEWVDPSIFNRFCRNIILPEVIDGQRCREAGIRTDLVRRFPGFKEQLYLRDAEPDDTLAGRLGLEPGMRRILLRPPASGAHYHRPEAEEIYRALLEALGAMEGVQVVLIPRSGRDVPANPPERMIVPLEPVDGPSLVRSMDLVVGGGGTMTREAAILGVPSVSFFRGRLGRVDEKLVELGRLRMPSDAASALEALGWSRGGLDPLPGSVGLRSLLAGMITGAADG